MTAHTRKHADPCLPAPAGRTKVGHTRAEQKLAVFFFPHVKNWLASSYITERYGRKNLKCCVNVAVLRVNIFQTAQIH